MTLKLFLDDGKTFDTSPYTITKIFFRSGCMAVIHVLMKRQSRRQDMVRSRLPSFAISDLTRQKELKSLIQFYNAHVPGIRVPLVCLRLCFSFLHFAHMTFSGLHSRLFRFQAFVSRRYALQVNKLSKTHFCGLCY